MSTSAMARFTLPDLHSLAALGEGPAGGWGWSLDGDDNLVEVTVAKPPAQIEPVAAAMLAAWATHHRRRSRSLRITGPLQSPLAFRTGLLTALAGRLHSRCAEPGLLRPVQMLGEHTMTDELAPLIEQMRIPDEQTSDAALHILEDLGRNVFHHARTCGEGAHFAASYNRDDRLLRLGVADCGQGIARDLQVHVSPKLSDAEAVEVALEPQISGSAQPGINRGVGLYVVRRLALAAHGAMWIKTGKILVEFSAATPSSVEVRARERGEEWRGVAVAVTLKSHELGHFRETLRAILDELDKPTAKSQGLKFFKANDDDPAWQSIAIVPDRNALCFERLRARALATDEIAPRLDRGERLSLDFTGTRTATQAYGHALLAELLQRGGPTLLDRLRFIGCSTQVRAVLMSAANYGLADHLVPDAPA